jgi:predicted nucleic acid-binding Zn finger protein
MTRGLLFLLSKHASDLEAAKLQPKGKHREMLDKHFATHEKTDWTAFAKALKSRAFVASVKGDERSDDKLKRYTEAMHMHATGKGRKFLAPGSKGAYIVKFHPKQDRWSCSCPDWGYKKSHQVDKGGQDCKHITAMKQQETAPSVVKEAATLDAVLSPQHIRSALGTYGNLRRSKKLDDETDRLNIKNQAYNSVFNKEASLRAAAAASMLKSLNN